MVLQEYMFTFSILFGIDTQITHCFAVCTYLLIAYEFKNMLKRTITLVKVLCAFRIVENVYMLSVRLLGFSGAKKEKWQDGCFLLQ